MKKLIIASVSVAVIVGGTFGAYKLNERRKIGKAVAKVTPVSFMTGYYYDNGFELGGMISEGNVQNVMADNNKLVEQLLVQEGDTVKKGDSLVKYDITALELDLKQKENAVALAELDIKNANRELVKLKNLKSSEMMPKPPEPEIPDIPPEPSPEPETPNNPAVETKDIINSTEDSYTGDGSAENPFLFNCTRTSLISGAFFSSLKESGSSAVFMVYENGDLMYQWNMSGANIRDDQGDISAGFNVTLSSGGGITVNWTENFFGSITIPKSDAAAENNASVSEHAETPAENKVDIEDFYESISRNYSEDYMYSRAELKKMISEKEAEIKRLEITKKSADLEYRIAKEQKESGTVIARIDGVVSTINENPEADQPYIVVQGEGGLTITGYIGELNFDKVSPGTLLNVTFWETGNMVEAEVTEISSVPISYESMNWGENPNSSSYEFTASVNGSVEIPVYDRSVRITLPSTDEDISKLVIPKVYVRQEEGRYYVFRADENGRLEKKYVKAGRTIYGSQIEILDGLTEEDKICFPYGKNIKEGIKTKDSDEVLW